MYSVLRHREPQAGESRTVRFEGRNYGGGVSFFLVDNEPGQGPGLHVHPYSETWIVRTGEAEFTVGDEKNPGLSGRHTRRTRRYSASFRECRDRTAGNHLHPCQRHDRTGIYLKRKAAGFAAPSQQLLKTIKEVAMAVPKDMAVMAAIRASIPSGCRDVICAERHRFDNHGSRRTGANHRGLP